MTILDDLKEKLAGLRQRVAILRRADPATVTDGALTALEQQIADLERLIAQENRKQGG